ncbi:hypothetical protein [Megamonas funiformis]|uniref:hypothetical protein n=1 Tax=Megamonas funiformis TaxID=437897 RepID=UPI003F7E8B29
MANKFLDSNGLQHLITKLKTEFSGNGIPSIRVSQIDTINIKEHGYEGKPVIYAVTSDDTPSVIIGIMQVFSDNASHVITQILTTHCAYNISTKDFNFSGSHNHKEIYQCYRTYNIAAPDLSNEAGTWSKWEPFADATILSILGALSTDINNLKSTTVTLGDDGKVKSSQLPSYLDDVVEFSRIIPTGEITPSSYTGVGDVVYISSINQFAITPTPTIQGSEKYYNNWHGRDNYSDEDFVPLAGKMFVDKSTDKIYRWNGSSLVEVSATELEAASINNDEIDNMFN